MTKSHIDFLVIRQRTGQDGFEIRAVVENGVCPYAKFWKKLFTKRQDEAKRVLTIFAQLGTYGKVSNDESFVDEEDGILAIKGFQARIYCFFDKERLILLTHGAIKKSKKANPLDLERAKRLRKAYKSHVRK
jgi:hypothetical protein